MSKRILIVEDSISQAVYLEHYFQMQGYEVAVVYTGGAVLSAAENYSPDLIVLDYQLPDLTGIEVCKNLKRNLNLRLIPVIMYSAESKLPNMVRAYEVGADYYVVKDEESNRVLQVLIETVFNRRAKRLEIARNATLPFDHQHILSA